MFRCEVLHELDAALGHSLWRYVHDKGTLGLVFIYAAFQPEHRSRIESMRRQPPVLAFGARRAEGGEMHSGGRIVREEFQMAIFEPHIASGRHREAERFKDLRRRLEVGHEVRDMVQA